MRHVIPVFAPILTLALGAGIPAAAEPPQEDPVLEVLDDRSNIGPYADPNG